MLTNAGERLHEWSRFAAEAPNLPIAQRKLAIRKAALAFVP
jgi:hypothetical protein